KSTEKSNFAPCSPCLRGPFTRAPIIPACRFSLLGDTPSACYHPAVRGGHGYLASRPEGDMRLFLAALLLMVGTIPASAQWLDRQTPGLPRTAEGKPNLTAPTPR